MGGEAEKTKPKYRQDERSSLSALVIKKKLCSDLNVWKQAEMEIESSSSVVLY